jgi:hypothetical protein
VVLIPVLVVDVGVDVVVVDDRSCDSEEEEVD